MQTLRFAELQVGEEYGPIEYVLTPEKVRTFEMAAETSERIYPTIASKDYAYLLRSKYDCPTVINAKHESWYHGPPASGARITVTGRLADKYVKRGREFVVIETISHDSDGRKLVRSRTTLLLGTVKRGDRE